MLRVKTPDEALEIIQTAFRPLERPPEQVPLSGALGRVLARNIEAGAHVAEHHGAVGACQRIGKIQYTDAFQRFFGHK